MCGVEKQVLKNAAEPVAQSAKELETVSSKKTFDFSSEELGYFTRRDKDGNIIGIIKTIFPR